MSAGNTPRALRAARLRRFELRKGGQNKFWQVHVDLGESSLSVRFGRMGTGGQERTKSFLLPADAVMAAEERIRAKLAEGYEEVAPPRPSANAGTRRPRDPARQPSTWDALEAAARERSGRRLAVGKDDNVDRKFIAKMTAACGFSPLPASYLEYLRRLRRTGEWHLIRPTKGWPSDFSIIDNRAPQRIRDSRKHLSSTYATHAPRLAPKAARLVPFASDGAGTYYCWNPSETDGRGEPAIYAADYDFRPDGSLHIKRLGSTLLEVLGHYQLGRQR